MFSHRFNSSPSTLLHPDHLWSQTPQSDRARQFFWCFYYNSTFRRSANLLTVSIKERCTATRALPLAQSGSVILWDFALSLYFLALFIVLSPPQPQFTLNRCLFIACWGIALAERFSFFFFFFSFCFGFFSLNVFWILRRAYETIADVL